MSVPYTLSLISRLLRDMPSERLATITASAFQKWPAKRIVPADTINALIANEQAGRRV